jgi:hypothetical protein
MTVFVQNDATGAGTGTLDANQGAVDLAIIANGDTGLGLAAAVGNRQQVTYARTDPGIPPTRLDTLVNTNFNPNYGLGAGPQAVPIVILPVLANFVRNDGALVTTFGGTALPPSNSGLAGAGLNTTTDCLVIYDTSQSNGSGYCTARAGTGGTLDLQTPNPVILYHELSHALRTVTNAMLALTAGCNPSSPEEAAAITDENDMRTQLAAATGTTAVLRDTGNHCGGTCSGGSSGNCCIVASVASGSPLSEEVVSLRRVRDGFIRKSEVGFAFFNVLHRDYYAFSPQVCTLLARRQELRPLVLEGFVRPLITILSTIEEFALRIADAAALGRRFVADHEDRDVAAARLGMLRRARDVLGGAVAGLPEDQRELAGLVAPALRSEHLLWGIVEPVRLYGSALELHLDGGDPQEVGEHLRAGIEAWAPRMPLDPVWASLTATEVRGELGLLEHTLLRSPQASASFRGRLTREYRVTAIDRLVDERTT